MSNVTSKGPLNRDDAYKASVAANIEAGRDPDHGINMGLHGSPALMAADILALDADEVPRRFHRSTTARPPPRCGAGDLQAA